MLFNERMVNFIAFEPSLINVDFFFPSLSLFCNRVKDTRQIIIEVLDDNDMMKTCDIYAIDNEIRSNTDWSDIFNININNVFYQRVGVYSDSLNWGIYIDNADFEIGIVGFKNLKYKNTFLECFTEERDVFQSIEGYIQEMDTMLKFSPENKELYNSIIENYS